MPLLWNVQDAINCRVKSLGQPFMAKIPVQFMLVRYPMAMTTADNVPMSHVKFGFRLAIPLQLMKNLKQTSESA